MTILTVEKTKQWMTEISKRMEANKSQLNDLDQAIGDGDHGTNMAQGFQGVVDKISETDYESVADVLKSVGITVKAKVGDTSGQVYGIAFLEMAMVLQDEEVDAQAFEKAIVATSTAIKEQCGVDFGEKTLYDVWFQVGEFLSIVDVEDWHEMLEACQATIEDTREMIAKHGRAAAFKELTLGHVDPGSMSSFYIFEALVEVLELEN